MGAVIGRLQSYVLGRSLVGAAGAAAITSSIVMLITFEEISRSFAGRSDVGFARLIELTLLRSPAVILLLLPFVFLFGALAAFVILKPRRRLPQRPQRLTGRHPGEDRIAPRTIYPDGSLRTAAIVMRRGVISHNDNNRCDVYYVRPELSQD